MDKIKLMKLAKIILSFASIKTDKAELVYDGELQAGTEVFVEIEGEMKPAEDGEYAWEDKRMIVKEGKVDEILEVESEPKEDETQEPKEEEMKKPCEMEEEQPKEEQPEPEKDEKDLKIEELEGLLADRDAIIEELNAKIKQLEEQVNKPVEEPVKMNRIEKMGADKEIKALKYFE